MLLKFESNYVGVYRLPITWPDHIQIVVIRKVYIKIFMKYGHFREVLFDYLEGHIMSEGRRFSNKWFLYQIPGEVGYVIS